MTVYAGPWSWLFDASICFGATPEATWAVGPAIVLPLLLVILVYGSGAMRLWRRSARGRPERLRQAGLFVAGWATLVFALVSPLHWLSQHLFTAHMIEHELMMAVAAPLIAASAPGAALMWALPRGWRSAGGHMLRVKWLGAIWRFVSRGGIATILHGVAIWIWHVPGLFEAALREGPLHYLQHASFLGTGLLFWWVVLPHRGHDQRLGASVMHLFLTSLHTTLLGVLLVLSPRLWYPANTTLSELWWLTPLEDQQLAGLVMWVPAGLVYGAAALWLAALWIRESGRAQPDPPHGDTYALRVR
ncbi:MULTISPECIES: cytochrome c oxidase assembly protein [unclassified Chelatococcus]|uniref:cytochrome c oxidase assembly protein n=1 Tax=unclassified Chelatococcus TaxID=2638111 RepID=UPI001BD03477|nr:MULTISPECIES: cytochrome c oxidase assembly protein [unclassified Chelatococcus]MBS7700026.1 cytochrome c oxidase assembly protein [Chelatococcus sp. YT9]MBX3556719.1 cytochrome c oxidase assembly protein [Chelatococcus sp.]